MKKVRTIFLIIGLIAFAASLICASIMFAKEANKLNVQEIEPGTEGDLLNKFFSPSDILFIDFVIFVMPFILSEIILLKNVYVLLTPEQALSRIIFCVLSSVLAMLIIIVLILWFIGCFDHLRYDTCMDIIGSLIPCLIVSFLLGLLGKRKRGQSPQCT